jgi:hypothetical protein
MISLRQAASLIGLKGSFFIAIPLLSLGSQTVNATRKVFVPNTASSLSV